MEDSFQKDELAAAITEAEDSLLVIKIMVVDTTTKYRMTVGRLHLNCRNKRLDQVNLQEEDVPVPPVNYDDAVTGYIDEEMCVRLLTKVI